MRALILIGVVAAWVGGHAPGKVTGRPAAPAARAAVDEASLDRSVQPCDDFYQFACGGWLAHTEIPADRPQWSRGFFDIEERNEHELRAILDELVKGGSIAPDPYGDKLGDFYGSCMDEAAIEASSASELAALLGGVDAIDSPDALARQLARMHLELDAWQDDSDPLDPLFGLAPEQDQRDATRVIASMAQSSLSLPDRESYLADDAATRTLREQFTAHVRAMLELAGVPAAASAAQAATVLRLEKRLAQAAMPRADRRDPDKIYHPMNVDGLIKLAPRFHWRTYLAALGHSGLQQLTVEHPPYFKALDQLLGDTSLGDLRTYLRWLTIHAVAPGLSKRFVDENQQFYGRVLEGTTDLPPRWRRCVDATDRSLGEALSRPYVRRKFALDSKATTLSMVRAVEAAMDANLAHLDWMDEASRRAARDKLGAIANKIGFPDRWRDYDRLATARGSYLQNARAASVFAMHRALDQIGKPVDRARWLITPTTVNAYYEPPRNEMCFPAGILQPPFFDRTAPVPVNFGAAGMVMGHELTHGFDDEGRKYDGLGNVHEWWTPSVSREFERRAQCVVDQFNGYVAVDELHINGKLTLGENIADLGGLKLAYASWQAARAGAPKTKAAAPNPKAAGGFTDEQLFWLGYAQAWCTKRRPELERVRVLTDPHATPRFRVDGPLSNLPEFAAAYSCHPGQKMVRPDRCQVW